MQATELLQKLNWRYAIKKFDPSKKIPESTWEALTDALVLAPSSFGLQPWKFVVVKDAALRQKLRPHSWDQSQITDADKLVVFCVKKPFVAADVERFVKRISEVRGDAIASLEGYKTMMMQVLKRSDAELKAWTSEQTYLALGFFLASCAAVGVDACPMEGIDPAKYDEILGLPAKGYHALCVATVGYRAADDPYAHKAKVRFAKNDVVETV